MLAVAAITYATCYANNIYIVNPSIVERNTADKFAIIQFDLTWENSWRHNAGPGGGLSYIGVVNGGTGYTSAPTVIISDGGGTGAQATAEISGGSVSKITIINAGTGFTSLPTISFSGGGGSGATADAHIHSWWDAAWVFMKYRTGQNYTSSTGISKDGNIITVPSTAGLRIGMEISTPPFSPDPEYPEFIWQSKFPPTAKVTAITSETTFIVSDEPFFEFDAEDYIIGISPWEHAWLHTSGHTAPSGSKIDIGLKSPEIPFDPLINPGIGAFVYRSEAGAGELYLSNIRLRWNYGANGVSNDDEAEIRVLGVEMVFVPQSSFYVGCGSTASADHNFYVYNSSNPAARNPYLISDSDAIDVGQVDNQLYYQKDGNIRGGDQFGPIPASFPKGYEAFYCMKYELTQLHYVEFLNTLNKEQISNRLPVFETNRFGIKLVNDAYISDYPYLPCNFLSWRDLAAVLDWTGLRPITELEFEKACRGPVYPVAYEYAWGNNLAVNSQSLYTLSDAGTGNEAISDNYKTAVGNAAFGYTTYKNDPITNDGPLRTGIFATSTSNRMQAGASYYGVMELSGNLWEKIITVGCPAGRAFTGNHGDGLLNGYGNADVDYWPLITSAGGMGNAGGTWRWQDYRLRVSNRYWRNEYIVNDDLREHVYGGRGVRTAP